MAEEKGQSGAAAAAAQVQAILEAAEQSAERIRAEAERDAGATRAAAARLAERAAELERRLEELAAGVREAIEGLRGELEQLERGPEPAPSADAPAVAEDPATRPDPEADDERIAEAEAAAGRKPDVGEATGDSPAVPEGARLLALKMALDGRPREETEVYLRENFELDDAETLLDEVYARAEGRN
jgi:hypothetical protein